MKFSIYGFISYWGFLLLLIPIFISFYRFHQRSVEMKALSLFVYLMLFFEIVGHILSSLAKSNLFLIHIYTPIEFCFYSFIFRRQIVSPWGKLFFDILVVAFIVFVLANSLFIQGFSKFNSYARVLESIILICFSLLLLFKLFLQEETVPLPKIPIFWFACGILFYFGGNLFIFIFSNFIHQYYLHLNKYIWALNALMNGFTYLLFAVALWKDGRK
jgi:hypothetical protein